MAKMARSNSNAASPWATGIALQRALKTLPSELLQSSPHPEAVQPHRTCARPGIIQDPISRLNPEMLYRQIQFVVAEGDWAQQGEEVSVGGEFG
ncbi:hypothetical protein [Nitrospira sp. Kam-Ns4a]